MTPRKGPVYASALTPLPGTRPGYSAEEYIGHHVAEFYADAPVLEDILDRLEQGETLREYEARLRRKDGSIRHVLIDSSVLFDEGKFVHTRCFTRDITERKQAHVLANAQTQALQLLAEGAPLEKVLAFLVSVVEDESSELAHC